MGFWGWRQGACAVFISVLVTACVPAHHAVLSPTLTPLTVTLTVVKPPGIIPATPRAPRILTATPVYQSVSVDILPPQCDELLNGEIQCIGVLRNTAPEAAGWVMIHAHQQAELGYISTVIEQWLIPAGTEAPYRLLLDSTTETFILSLQAVAVNRKWTPLEVSEERGELTASGYQLTARLYNATPMAVTGGRAVLMLFDGETLINYRIIELGDLSVGESILLKEVWYGEYGGNLRHTISAIGWEA